MPSFITSTVSIQRFASAMYGVQVGSSTLSSIQSDSSSLGGISNAFNGYYSSSFGSVPTATVANSIVTNLGLTGSAATAGAAYVKGQLDAAAPGARGVVVTNILNLFAGLETDATYGSAAKAWNTKVDAAVSYTGPTDVVFGSTAGQGTAFALTTGTNTFTGTPGNDTFDAGLSTSSIQTLNSGDRLDGGAGTDDLFAIINSTVTPAQVKDIENVSLTATSTATVDFSNATGLVSVVNQASTAALTISGISKVLNVTVRDTSVAGQVISFNDVSGTADADTIVLQNVTGSAGLQVSGVELLTLQSTGAGANAVALTAANATTLNITGNQALTLGTIPATVVTFDASANTASLGTGVSLTTANTAASTVIGSAGNDTIVIRSSAVNDSISAGAGNDSIRFVGNYSTDDTVDGGDGTDTLSVLATNIASATTPTTYRVTNIETIAITDALASSGSYTPANTSATATRLNVTGATDNAGAAITTGAALSAGSATITGPAGAFTLGLGASLAANTLGILNSGSTLTINDTGTGITDTLTITNSAAQTGSGNLNVYNSQILAVNGYETITINTGSVSGGTANALGAITVTGDVGGTAAETVNFSGANIVSAGVITADIINASALTAAGTSTAPTFSMTTASTATTITGSAGIDILMGSLTTASSVDGGAGNDTVTGGAAADTLLGGAGQDTLDGAAGNDSLLGGDGNDNITAGTGNDYVDGGAGNDTVVIGANLASGDTLIGGADTDTLSIVGSSTAPTAAAAAGVSGFETLLITGTAQSDVTMSNFINNPFTRVTSSQSGASNVTIAGATSSVATLGLNNTTANTGTISLSRLVNTTADSLTVAIGNTSSTAAGNVAETALTISDEDTITITSSGLSGDTNTITTLTATDAASITVTGARQLTIPTLTAGIVLTRLDLSAATGAVSIGATAVTNTANMTILGATNVASTVSGGSGNDTITGGIGNDSLLGGSGNDSIVGGDGNDTITGGAGSDTMDGGTGTDTFSAVGMNSTTIDGTTATSTGAVINLGSTSITSSAANTTMGGSFGISSLLGSIGSNTAVYMYSDATTSGSNAVDTLVSMENVVGSGGTDYITGSSAANRLEGGAGADTIAGGAGADTLGGGSGRDVIYTGGISGTLTSATTVDVIELAFGDAMTYTSAATTVTITTADLIYGMGTDDRILLSNSGTMAYTAVTATAITGSFVSTATYHTAQTLGADNRVSFLIGTYTNASSFTYGANGPDTLVIYDTDSAVTTTAFANIVLIGLSITSGVTVTATSDGALIALGG